jgi:hypothetical protein
MDRVVWGFYDGLKMGPENGGQPQIVDDHDARIDRQGKPEKMAGDTAGFDSGGKKDQGKRESQLHGVKEDYPLIVNRFHQQVVLFDIVVSQPDIRKNGVECAEHEHGPHDVTVHLITSLWGFPKSYWIWQGM